MTKIEERDLFILNFILETDPELKDRLIRSIQKLNRQMKLISESLGLKTRSTHVDLQGKDIDVKILLWFEGNKGREVGPKEIANALHLKVSSTAFGRSMRRLVREGRLKSTGMAGRGARYWLDG